MYFQVMAFFVRPFLSVGLVCIGLWPVIMYSMQGVVEKSMRLVWIGASILLASFTYMPVVGKEPFYPMVYVWQMCRERFCPSSFSYFFLGHFYQLILLLELTVFSSQNFKKLFTGYFLLKREKCILYLKRSITSIEKKYATHFARHEKNLLQILCLPSMLFTPV